MRKGSKETEVDSIQNQNILRAPVAKSWTSNVAFSLGLSEYQYSIFAHYINKKAPEFLQCCADGTDLESKVVRLKMSKLIFKMGLTDQQVTQLCKIKMTLENSDKYQKFVDLYEVASSDDEEQENRHEDTSFLGKGTVLISDEKNLSEENGTKLE